MHHVGHVDWDFSEPPAGYAGSAEGYSSSSLVGSHTGAVHTDLVHQQARARRLDGPAPALVRVRRLCPGRRSGAQHRRPSESAARRRLRAAAHRDAARLGEPRPATAGPVAGPQHAPAPAARPASRRHLLPARRRPTACPAAPNGPANNPVNSPVSRYLGHYAGTPPQQEALRVDDRVRDREPAGMDTALLAYSGISVKMMVDRGLGAELLVMFMVDYEPGGAAQAHDHPFEEAYFFLERGDRSRTRRHRLQAAGRRRPLRRRRLDPRLLQHGPRTGAVDRNPGAAAARPSFLSLDRAVAASGVADVRQHGPALAPHLTQQPTT